MTHYIKVAGLFPPPDYAHAAIVEAGDRLVFTAGAVPLDAAGELVGRGDFIAQTKQVLVNLDAALRAAGSDLEHVVMVLPLGVSFLLVNLLGARCELMFFASSRENFRFGSVFSRADRDDPSHG
jgi:hypothetical protein